MPTSQTQKIIGFDLGHGDTALAWVGLHNDQHPTPLEVYKAKKQPTAIAYDPKRAVMDAPFQSQRDGVLIGERAVRSRRAENFQIAFKRRPPGDALYEKTMRDFVTAIHDNLVDSGQLAADDDHHVYIGCPSGWMDETRQAYQQLLAAPNTPFTKLVVCAESRAALMHAVDANELDVRALRGAILAIDIGSSTTDFTLISGRSDATIEDFGDDLGATLIDKAILAYSIDNHPQCAKLKAVLERHPHFRYRCEYLCREAKEKYFLDPTIYDDADFYVSVGIEDFNLELPFVFKPLLNKPIMAQLLQTPLPALQNRTWPECFRAHLQGVQERLTAQGIEPKALLVTGGASRMDFIKPICEEIFPTTPYKQDSAPEYTIAQGLARWGRVDIRTQRFMAEINALLDKEIPRLVERNLPTLINAIAGALSKGLANKVMEPGMKRWRDRELITLNDLEPYLNKQSKKWLQSGAAQEKISSKMDDWVGPIQETLSKELDEIGRRYGLNGGAIRVKADVKADATGWEALLFEDPTILTDLINGVIAIVVGVIIAVIAIAVNATGPIGWALAFLAWAFTAGAAMEEAEKHVKQADIPTWVRGLILSDERIDEKIEEKRPELTAKVKNILSTEKLRQRLAADMTQELKLAARREADKARLLIV